MNIYDIKIKDNQGNEMSMSEYKGKVLLIVNTATKCGHTKQYVSLQELYTRYKDKNFEILDFPCNQFAGQAPGTAEKIAEFCQTKFGITFRQFAKVSVNGRNACDLYQFLTEQSKPDPNGFEAGKIKWNFAKFLVDRNGNVIARFLPKTKPEEIVDDIEKIL